MQHISRALKSGGRSVKFLLKLCLQNKVKSFRIRNATNDQKQIDNLYFMRSTVKSFDSFLLSLSLALTWNVFIFWLRFVQIECVASTTANRIFDIRSNKYFNEFFFSFSCFLSQHVSVGDPSTWQYSVPFSRPKELNISFVFICSLLLLKVKLLIFVLSVTSVSISKSLKSHI